MSDKKESIKSSEDTVKFSVVMPTELNEKVQKEASVEMRTKIQQINWIVEKHFKEKESLAEVT